MDDQAEEVKEIPDILNVPNDEDGTPIIQPTN